ncbi:MAG: right-handed parallel beta-helix repeat-containing protein [Planctomycetes bacterium]|nr:right-handed parallel beta-helix repeat-containing protein [Planctomycetota bacterium]
MRTRRFGIAFAFVCLASASARAGTLHVPDPGLGITTLQQALTAASAGDTIVLAAGVHLGNAQVSGKAGLRIRGAGTTKTVLDAMPSAPTPSGPALIADDCDGLRLERLTIRHARAATGSGAGVVVTNSDHVELDRVLIVDCEEAGVQIAGNFATLTQCEIVGCEGGIDLASDFASVTKTAVRNDRLRGIGVLGSDVTVSKCTVRSIRVGSGISITGERPTVTKCVVEAVHADDSSAISTTGSDPDIAKNKIAGAFNGLFVVYGANGLVRGNVIEDCAGSGIRFGAVAHDLDVRDNVVRRCGTNGAPAVWIDGDTERLTGNVVQDCAGSAFVVFSSNCVLRKNRAERCGKDGFNVETGVLATTLDANVAVGNHGEGFENSGTATVLTKNTAKQNRTEFADDGTLGTVSGNSFSTVSAPTPVLD